MGEMQQNSVSCNEGSSCGTSNDCGGGGGGSDVTAMDGADETADGEQNSDESDSEAWSIELRDLPSDEEVF